MNKGDDDLVGFWALVFLFVFAALTMHMHSFSGIFAILAILMIPFVMIDVLLHSVLHKVFGLKFYVPMNIELAITILICGFIVRVCYAFRDTAPTHGLKFIIRKTGDKWYVNGSALNYIMLHRHNRGQLEFDFMKDLDFRGIWDIRSLFKYLCLHFPYFLNLSDPNYAADVERMQRRWIGRGESPTGGRMHNGKLI